MRKVGLIYKIVTAPEWEAARERGSYSGSDHDLRDGYIHFSSAAQLAETARKYFTGVPDLVLLAVEPGAQEISPALRWEPSRGGGLFPHLYTDMPLSAVTSVTPLALRPDGVPILPSELI